MTSRPTVTVAMPVYNGAATLQRAIDSVLAQTYTDFELLIIDDGSSDDSHERISRNGDSRIRLLVQEKNRGLAETRNHLVAESQGEFIAWLDCDDWAHPERLERQLAVLQDSRIGLCSAWVNVQEDPQRNIVRRHHRRMYEHGPTSNAALHASLLFRNPFQTSTTTIRRSAVLDYNLDFQEPYAPAEDYQMWSRIGDISKMHTIPAVLGRIFELETGASARGQENQVAGARQVREDLMTKIGLPITARALASHRLVCESMTSSATAEEFAGAAEWLEEILLWNEQQRVYEQSALTRAAVEQFGILLLRCARLDPLQAPSLLRHTRLSRRLPAAVLTRVTDARFGI